MIRGPKGPECHALPSQTENLPERPPESLCGDNPSGWAFGQMGQIHMGRANPFGALVAGHAADEFLPLREAVDERRSRKEVGVGAPAEAAAAYRPDSGRPECGAGGVWRNGSTAAGVSRWRCRCCGRRFTSPTGTVLEHCRKPLPVWISFIRLMRRNVPVEYAAEEGQPRVIRLRVHHVDAQDAPPAARVAADGRDDGRGGHAAPAAALDVGGVEPDVGHRRAVEGPRAELIDVGVQARRDGAHLVLGGPGHAHLLGDAPHLAGARAGGVHLGDGGHEGAVHALVALDRVVGEEAAGAELRDAQRQRADAGGEAALPVAVAAVRPAAAQLVGLGVHYRIHDLLGEAPEQLLHVDGAVVEPGHGEHVRRRV